MSKFTGERDRWMAYSRAGMRPYKTGSGKKEQVWHFFGHHRPKSAVQQPKNCHKIILISTACIVNYVMSCVVCGTLSRDNCDSYIGSH